MRSCIRDSMALMVRDHRLLKRKSGRSAEFRWNENRGDIDRSRRRRSHLDAQDEAQEEAIEEDEASSSSDHGDSSSDSDSESGEGIKGTERCRAIASIREVMRGSIKWMRPADVYDKIERRGRCEDQFALTVKDSTSRDRSVESEEREIV